MLSQILDRAEKKAAEMGQTILRMTLNMDISAACADVQLDLDRLLAFDDENFIHDIWGIMRHMNRETGKLGGCFLPRCAKPASIEGARPHQAP